MRTSTPRRPASWSAARTASSGTKYGLAIQIRSRAEWIACTNMSEAVSSGSAGPDGTIRARMSRAAARGV